MGMLPARDRKINAMIISWFRQIPPARQSLATDTDPNVVQFDRRMRLLHDSNVRLSAESDGFARGERVGPLRNRNVFPELARNPQLSDEFTQFILDRFSIDVKKEAGKTDYTEAALKKIGNAKVQNYSAERDPGTYIFGIGKEQAYGGQSIRDVYHRFSTASRSHDASHSFDNHCDWLCYDTLEDLIKDFEKERPESTRDPPLPYVKSVGCKMQDMWFCPVSSIRDVQIMIDSEVLKWILDYLELLTVQYFGLACPADDLKEVSRTPQRIASIAHLKDIRAAAGLPDYFTGLNKMMPMDPATNNRLTWSLREITIARQVLHECQLKSLTDSSAYKIIRKKLEEEGFHRVEGGIKRQKLQTGGFTWGYQIPQHIKRMVDREIAKYQLPVDADLDDVATRIQLRLEAVNELHPIEFIKYLCLRLYPEAARKKFHWNEHPEATQLLEYHLAKTWNLKGGRTIAIDAFTKHAAEFFDSQIRQGPIESRAKALVIGLADELRHEKVLKDGEELIMALELSLSETMERSSNELSYGSSGKVSGKSSVSIRRDQVPLADHSSTVGGIRSTVSDGEEHSSPTLRLAEQRKEHRRPRNRHQQQVARDRKTRGNFPQHTSRKRRDKPLGRSSVQKETRSAAVNAKRKITRQTLDPYDLTEDSDFNNEDYEDDTDDDSEEDSETDSDISDTLSLNINFKGDSNEVIALSDSDCLAGNDSCNSSLNDEFHRPTGDNNEFDDHIVHSKGDKFDDDKAAAFLAGAGDVSDRMFWLRGICTRYPTETGKLYDDAVEVWQASKFGVENALPPIVSVRRTARDLLKERLGRRNASWKNDVVACYESMLEELEYSLSFPNGSKPSFVTTAKDPTARIPAHVSAVLSHVPKIIVNDENPRESEANDKASLKTDLTIDLTNDDSDCDFDVKIEGVYFKAEPDVKSNFKREYSPLNDNHDIAEQQIRAREAKLSAKRRRDEADNDAASARIEADKLQLMLMRQKKQRQTITI